MAWWKSARSMSVLSNSTRLWGSSLLAFALVFPGLLGAASGADRSRCPGDSVGECARYQQLDAAMDSNDLVVQLAALRDASQDLDPALRALIFGKALRSPDPRLRTAGLRYVLASRSSFDVVVEPLVHPNPVQDKVYKSFSTLKLDRVKLDEKTDELSANVPGGRAVGSMIRGGFELGWAYCRLRVLAGQEDLIRGTLRCQYPNAEPVELKVSIELS
jgi:hypothetical protein